MKPTLANLKKVTRKSHEPEPYARYFIRPISILFTWIFVRTPISANQVTIVQEILGITGAISLGFGDYNLSLLGVFLLQLGYVLDCSDGEVARWKNQQSVKGVFLDLVGHVLVIPAYLYAFAFGIWMRTGQIEVLIIGFITALLTLRLERNTMLSIVDSMIMETDNPQYNFTFLAKEIDNSKSYIDMGSAGAIGRRSFIQSIFRYPASMNVISIVLFIEYILFKNHIEFEYTLSYLVLMIYGFILTIGRLWGIKKVFSKDLTKKRFIQILKNAMMINKNTSK